MLGEMLEHLMLYECRGRKTFYSLTEFFKPTYKLCISIDTAGCSLGEDVRKGSFSRLFSFPA